MPQIPFFLITGFLGAGKTTLLKSILCRHADNLKIAVVQNEFAPSGVDGEELKRTGKTYRLLELNRGSVFCVCLFSDFCRSLAGLIDEHHPDAVFVEATGLADPVAIAQLLETPELKVRVYLRHIWCLVDVPAYLKFTRAIGQVVHQVRVADTILLNKRDLASPDELERVKREMASLNPFAAVTPTVFARISLENIIETQIPAPVAGRIASEKPFPRPGVKTCVLRKSGAMARGELEDFVRTYAPSVWRLKGFATCREGNVSVQSSFGDPQFADAADYAGPTELVALGTDFDPDAMRVDFERLFRPVRSPRGPSPAGAL